MKAAIALLVILIIIAAIFGSMYVGRKNQMVTLDEQVKSNWSQVDVQLQRRADLIPNLVATVKGFAAHEEAVYGEIAKARSALLNAQTPSDKIAANGQLDGALGRLLAIVENYPQLKSNENFLRLQDELAGTENRIAVARKNYNDSIQAYNTYILQFPNSLFASWAGYKRNDAYFQATPASREVPKVDFNTPSPSRQLRRQLPPQPKNSKAGSRDHKNVGAQHAAPHFARVRTADRIRSLRPADDRALPNRSVTKIKHCHPDAKRADASFFAFTSERTRRHHARETPAHSASETR